LCRHNAGPRLGVLEEGRRNGNRPSVIGSGSWSLALKAREKRMGLEGESCLIQGNRGAVKTFSGKKTGFTPALKKGKTWERKRRSWEHLNLTRGLLKFLLIET